MTIAIASPTLAPDRELPQRDVLLDGEAMHARLERLLGVAGALRIAAYEQARVKYRVGESLRVVHRVEVAGAQRHVASRSFRAGESRDVFLRALATAGPPRGDLLPVAWDESLETVFWTFPSDRRLTGLDALDAGSGLLSRLLGREVASTALAAYAPEKSATAACLGAGGEQPLAYAKVFADAASAAWSARAHAHVAALVGSDHPLLRTPAVLAHSDPDQLVVLEALAGRRLDALRAADVEAGLRAYGAALASLHELGPVAGAPAFTRLTGDRRRTAAQLIERARPDVALPLRRLLRDLAAAAHQPGERLVCLHGDVHAKNAIVRDDGRVALIDLDQLAIGTASAELGSMLAGLRYHALLAGDDGRAAAEQRALLGGYACVRALPDPAALRWSTAAALLCERALRAVNRVRADGLARLDAILADGQAALEGGAR